MPIRPTDGPLGLSPMGAALLRAGAVAWSLVGIALVLYGLLRVAAFLRVLLLIVGLAAIIVLVLEPAVSRLERRIPRVAGTAIVYVCLLAPAAAGLWWLGGVLLVQLRSFLEQAPALLERAGTFADEAWRQGLDRGLPLPAPTPEAWLTQNREGIIRWAINLVTAATRFTGFLVASLAGPVVAFYVLAELPRLRTSAARILPADRRTDVLEGLRIVGGTVAAFFRGQLFIAAIVGLVSTAGLIVLDVPYAVLVGSIAGVTNLVPFFGPIVGSIPGVALALIEGGVWRGVAVLVLFVVIQQLESHVLSPLVLGASVRLRPVVVLIGMLTGAIVAGLLGMLLVIPLIASIKGLYERFGTSEPEGAPPRSEDAGVPS